jgi:hypothetical protein
MKRQIVINYDRCQISIGDDATTNDVDGWLDNLAALIAAEFEADVNLVTGYTGRYGEFCHDDDVNDRLREISSGDEWLDLLPARD